MIPTSAITVSNVIIVLNVLVSLAAFSNKELLAKFMMNPYRVKHNREYYRFITSGFIHLNLPHLLFNMFSFHFFGPAVETTFQYAFGRFGNLYFIALYLLALVVSDLSTYMKHKDNPGYNSLGASGAVSAIIFAFIMFQPLQSICVFISLCMPGIVWGVIYLALSYYQGTKSADGINHEAHLFGALFGLIFCVVTYPRSVGLFIDQIQNWSLFH